MHERGCREYTFSPGGPTSGENVYARMVHMLRPIPESIQFQNWTGRRPIPFGKFRFGMGSPSIQKQNVSQTRMSF
jgi:hypothetical protein